MIMASFNIMVLFVCKLIKVIHTKYGMFFPHFSKQAIWVCQQIKHAITLNYLTLIKNKIYIF